MRGALAARAEALLQRHWWRPRSTWLARLLAPLSALYGFLRETNAGNAEAPLPVPVLVVGNVVAGGAGKTPTVIALVQALQAAGHRPGVVSRGYGRRGDGVREVRDGDDAQQAGDEPLLIRRRCRVPVWVGRKRSAAARALCQAHREVDVIVSDDGLQHAALPRQAELVVFDERGVGNGRLLPAGPLREPWPGSAARRRVLYTAGVASTAEPGALATRTIGRAWPLAAWQSGDSSAAVELQALGDRPLLAVAGLAAPEKFFGMLEAVGLRQLTRCPLPDHHAYPGLPWPEGTADVITTEKDAVKLVGHALHGTRVWVVPLDLRLPPELIAELIALLFPS